MDRKLRLVRVAFGIYAAIVGLGAFLYDFISAGSASLVVGFLPLISGFLAFSVLAHRMKVS